MSRPGNRLQHLAARVCSERTRRRLIEPAIADLQAEVGAARRTGSPWRTLRAGARRGVAVAIGAIVVATGLFVVPIVDNFPRADPTRLGLYVVPSALAITVPVGLMLGIAWAFHGAARTRKLARAALAVAGLCSIGMFVNLGWLEPEANQAFREMAFGSEDRGRADQPPARGFNELAVPAMLVRLREARALESRSEIRALEVAFHRKLAFSVSALPMVGVVLALAFRRRWSRGRLAAAAIGTLVLYIIVNGASELYGARLGLPTAFIGWSGTASCAVAAVILLTSSRWPARA